MFHPARVVSAFAISFCVISSLAEAGEFDLRRDNGKQPRLAEKPDTADGEDVADARRGTSPEEVAKWRNWLLGRLTAELRLTPAKQQQIDAALRELSDKQLAYLVRLYVSGKREQQQRALAALKQQLARSGGYPRSAAAGGSPYVLRPGRSGFAPVITWLPSGTTLNVGAVVSPDRRYVRINAIPFFSQVGPVRTFNFKTGRYSTPGRHRRPIAGSTRPRVLGH